jgi:GH24 family phage-related lysozyme (muramidase)
LRFEILGRARQTRYKRPAAAAIRQDEREWHRSLPARANHMQLSRDGVNFLIELERPVPGLYTDNAGNCTVGVGHLVHPGACVSLAKAAPTANMAGLTTQEIEYLRRETPFLNGLAPNDMRRLLTADVTISETAINDRVTVGLSQTQYDALVSLCFNVGANNFINSSLLKKLNHGSYGAIANEMRRWNKSGGFVNQGLVNRREREAELFDNGRY